MSNIVEGDHGFLISLRGLFAKKFGKPCCRVYSKGGQGTARQQKYLDRELFFMLRTTSKKHIISSSFITNTLKCAVYLFFVIE